MPNTWTKGSPERERAWERAKSRVRDQYPKAKGDRFYKLTMSIAQNMAGEKKGEVLLTPAVRALLEKNAALPNWIGSLGRAVAGKVPGMAAKVPAAATSRAVATTPGLYVPSVAPRPRVPLESRLLEAARAPLPAPPQLPVRERLRQAVQNMPPPAPVSSTSPTMTPTSYSSDWMRPSQIGKFWTGPKTAGFIERFRVRLVA